MCALAVPSMKETTGAGNRRLLRVSDILLLSTASSRDGEMDSTVAVDGGGKKRRSRVLRRFSSRVASSRWLGFGRRIKVGAVGKGREEAGDGFARIRCSTNCPNDDSNFEEYRGGSDTVNESGRGKETYFNMGVGFGLIFLTAASKNELNKMMKVRTEVEKLLENVKEELRSKETDSKRIGSCNNLICSSIDVKEGSNSNNHLHTSSYMEHTVLCDPFLKLDTPVRKEHEKGIDQLEVELEAELELLELQLDMGHLSKQPQQQSIEMSIEDTAPRESLSTTFGDTVEQLEGSTRMHYAVPPDELERKLHQVVEARQQERIKELEAALEYANEKILEKENEASWWKDTAQLISQHDPVKSPFVYRQISEAPHFLKPAMNCTKPFQNQLRMHSPMS